ncbi:MAG: ATP-binding cassette domain-containing protein [Velocimicrobium sp.]
MEGNIKIRNYCVSRGNFQLNNINLEIEGGEIFAILGRTGSGKTVLLESIIGMYAGECGEILIDGQNVLLLSVEDSKIGFVYQDYQLFPHMKVYDNIIYGLKMHQKSKKEQFEKAEYLMNLLGISYIRDQYPCTLSGGECQRVALARTLALEPSILLLDEPFSALDPTTKKKMYQEIVNIHRKFQCTIVFVTHDFKEAQVLAKRVGIVLGGELKAIVESQNLLTATYESEVEEFLGRM